MAAGGAAQRAWPAFASDTGRPVCGRRAREIMATLVFTGSSERPLPCEPLVLCIICSSNSLYFLYRVLRFTKFSDMMLSSKHLMTVHLMSHR